MEAEISFDFLAAMMAEFRALAREGLKERFPELQASKLPPMLKGYEMPPLPPGFVLPV